jgi:long-subunit fatty acid transport protein
MASAVQRSAVAVRVRRITPALLFLTALAGGAAAQNFPQPLFKAPFNFLNPGARSLGFGGAFIALADDATASFANPAGLVQLLEPEVSFDVRLWDYSTRYTAGGRITGDPTGIGLDQADGLEFATSSESLTGLSFLAYVYPRERWSFAFHRHLQGNFHSSTETQGLFASTPQGTRRITDQRTATDFELVTYGFSTALQVSERVSVGLGIVYFDGIGALDAETYALDDPAGSIFDPISFRPDRLMVSQTLLIDDSDWGVSAGVLWKLNSSWSLGAVYRASPTFDIRGLAVLGPANTIGLEPGTEVSFLSEAEITFPDGYGLGVAYRSQSGRTTISFEWDQVEYTDVTDSLGLDDQDIDDANELRLGGEYVFVGSTPIVAIRMGLWHEPDRLMRGNGTDPVVDAFLPAGDDDLHFAAGLGFVFESFQIDLGMDLSDAADTFSVSAVFTL